ncbi:MAG: glycine dehydrogenase subunit 1 [Planctomycetota bacterium]|jgi:glycine dehydrogenase subunit 1
MRYSAITPAARREMLERIGVKDASELMASIPEDVRMSEPIQVPGPMAEAELCGRLESIKGRRPKLSFAGAGLYQHYVPATVNSLAARSEWVTSYTPYQPELAQGTLTMYYEFQTYIAQLTGQEIANGGMYDGSTSMVEAILMAIRLRAKADKVVYASAGLHPSYAEVLHTYMRFADVKVVSVALDPATGKTDWSTVSGLENATAVIVQSPNFFGMIEDCDGLPEKAFKVGVCTEALSMAMLKPLAVDIMTGECQSFGIPMQLGGPTAGFFATKKSLVRKMPGRLVGRTVDAVGNEAFCITLATREQFIRREKATSNICTSSGLMCLRATLYLSLMGGKGLADLARKNTSAAAFFAKGLEDLGFPRVYSGPIFNEFVIDTSSRPGAFQKLLDNDIVLGVSLERFDSERKGQYLVAVTEMQYGRAEAHMQEIKDLVLQS